MSTFEDVKPLMRKFINWYGTNYFPLPNTTIKHKDYVVELVHVPNDGDLIGVTVDVVGVVLCGADDDGFVAVEQKDVNLPI